MQGDSSQQGQTEATPNTVTDAVDTTRLQHKANTKVHLPWYHLISRIPGPRSFAARIFMLSFIGTQLPMFLLLLYVLLNAELTQEGLIMASIVLITALLGSASTVIALIAYAEPVTAISKAVQNFANADDEPSLPETYTDEIGELMSNTQGALRKLRGMLNNMHELSIRDELTGLYNRRFFAEQAEILLNRAMRYGEPLTLIFIDIDNFKTINDQYSHQAGDLALKQIANIMTETARGSDVAARLGGDEFVIVLPNTPMSRAQQIAERLRKAMEDCDWNSIIPGATVTMSIGMAEAGKLDTIEAMMERADSNLFKAKKGGRNQIHA